MFRLCSIVGFLTSVVFTVPTPGVAQDTQHARDTKRNIADDTPEEAIASFFAALADGDHSTAKHLLVSPTKMADYCRIQAELSLAFIKLGAAGESRFGDEGKVFRQAVPASSAISKLREVKPVIHGDRAEWRSNPNAPMKLRRLGDGWRLDLHSSFKKESHLEMSNRVFQRIASYVHEIAERLEQGDFNTVAAVQAELKKQRQAMNADFRKSSKTRETEQKQRSRN